MADKLPKAKDSVDLTDWDPGDWSSHLQDSIKSKIDFNGSTLEIPLETYDGLYEAAALQIAKEAIEAFFDNAELHVQADKDGILIDPEGYGGLSEPVLLP